jgi:hypothetical protein
MSINPDCPQRGPYEASEGIYHGHGQQKLGVDKQIDLPALKFSLPVWAPRDKSRPSFAERTLTFYNTERIVQILIEKRERL